MSYSGNFPTAVIYRKVKDNMIQFSLLFSFLDACNGSQENARFTWEGFTIRFKNNLKLKHIAIVIFMLMIGLSVEPDDPKPN